MVTNEIYGTTIYPSYNGVDSTYNQLQLNFNAENSQFYLQIYCIPGSVMPSVASWQVNCDVYDGYCYTQIELNSNVVCSETIVPQYVAPVDHDYLTAPIYLSGELAMFLMSKVAYEQTETQFVGTLYYSYPSMSYLINGTLSNSDGETDFVTFIFQGSSDSPPKLFSYVTPPGKSSHACIIVANGFDYFDGGYYENATYTSGWFSSEFNTVYTVPKEYTSIYFNKGSSFTVDTWSIGFQSSPWNTLMQRSDNGLPVYLSAYVLAPFSTDVYDGPAFVSELDWTNISFNSLPADTFSLPLSWGCVL